MKRKQSGVRQEFTNKLLSDALRALDMIGSTYFYPGLSYERILSIRDAKERKIRYQKIRYLIRKKIIELEKTEKGLFVALTEKGKKKAIRESIKNSKNKLPKGNSCIILFDIPETARESRDNLRNFLKYSGFKKIQKSAWETENDVFDAVTKFIRIAKIEKWVTVIDSKRKV